MNAAQKINSSSEGKPFVSVIMPVHNESAFIERSLEALLGQTYPHDYMEIIVADGMSSDDTRSVIEQVKGRSRFPITIVDNPRRIAPAGLNCAVREAKGEIIIRVDGHCEIEPDYIVNCVKHLTARKAEAVGGPIETIGETLRAQAIATAMSSIFGVGGSAFRTVRDREMYVDTVAFPGYTREILQKTGEFNEELVRNQDDEYNFRIRKMGGRILLSPDIRSKYYSRSTFRSLWRQYYQYGYWKIRVLQMHPRQMSRRQFIPFLFVTTLLLTISAALVSGIGKWILLGVVSSYLFANLTAAVFAGRTKFILIPQLMLSFSILHLSYGLGFAAGLIAFRKLWNRLQQKNDLALSKSAAE